jgi:hypothetical protein
MARPARKMSALVTAEMPRDFRKGQAIENPIGGHAAFEFAGRMGVGLKGRPSAA